MAKKSHPPLQPIEQRSRRFAQGQAVAFGGGERGFGGERVNLEALAGEGAGGAGQLPGVGDQQDRWQGGAGVVLGQPGGDAAGGDTELDETLGGGASVARHISRQRGVAAELDGGAAGDGGAMAGPRPTAPPPQRARKTARLAAGCAASHQAEQWRGSFRWR